MNNLAHNIVTTQAPRKGEQKVNKDGLKSYVKTVINNYATYQKGGFILFADDLPRHEQIIFLSRLCDAEDYAWYMRTDSRLTAAINEYLPRMQELILDAMPSVWADIQDEIDKWKHQHEPKPYRTKYKGGESYDSDDYFSKTYNWY